MYMHATITLVVYVRSIIIISKYHTLASLISTLIRPSLTTGLIFSKLGEKVDLPFHLLNSFDLSESPPPFL